MAQDKEFKGRQFTAEVILWAVRWYLMFPISYRDLELMLQDRGVEVDHTTIFRWIQAYQPVDEVVVQRGRWSKPILKTIRAGTALLATRTMRMAASAPASVVRSGTKTYQPRATASFGVPAPINRRISSPRLCPATWIR